MEPVAEEDANRWKPIHGNRAARPAAGLEEEAMTIRPTTTGTTPRFMDQEAEGPRFQAPTLMLPEEPDLKDASSFAIIDTGSPYSRRTSLFCILLIINQLIITI